MGNTVDREFLPDGVDWEPDEVAQGCRRCEAEFGLLSRRHHCRKCGLVVCGACSLRRHQLRGDRPKVRVCDVCAVCRVLQIPVTIHFLVLEYLPRADMDNALRVCRKFQRCPMLPLPWVDDIQGYFIYEESDKLADGMYGPVYRATCRATGQLRAVKVIRKVDIFSLRDWDRVLREINVLRLLRHPNCVSMEVACQCDTDLYIVMDFVQGLQLFDAIVRRRQLSEADVARLTLQLLHALDYLHNELSVVHRDIKPENVIVSEDLQHITIVDFGFAKFFGPKFVDNGVSSGTAAVLYNTFAETLTALEGRQEGEHRSGGITMGEVGAPPPHRQVRGMSLSSTPCGTLHYAPPEVIKGVVHRRNVQVASHNDVPKMDVFSAGIVAYLMLIGNLPFSGRLIMAQRTHHRKEGAPRISTKQQQEWAAVSDEARGLVEALMNQRPQNRPSATEALQSPWLSWASEKATLTSATRLGTSMSAVGFADQLEEVISAGLTERERTERGLQHRKNSVARGHPPVAAAEATHRR